MAKRKLKLKKGSKNNELPIDNGLPKAYWGAILNTVLPQITGLAGAGAGAMTGATAGMASGAANGLAGATGAGGGLGSLGSGAGGGLQSLGSKAAGSLQGNMNKDTLGSLGKGMDVLSPLANATMQAVSNMIKSFQPEEEKRPVFQNIGATYGNGGEINIKPSKKGTFTKAAKQRGMGVQQFASKVLANKDNYSPAMVKKANFARNAAKWKKAMGGIVEPEIFEMGGLTGTYMDAFDAMGYGGNVYDHPDYSDYMALGGMTGVDPTKPPMYSWSTGSVPAMGSKIQNTQSSSISKTIPSVIYEGRTFPEVEVNARNLSNPVDTFTNAYKNKPLGKDAFPWKYTDETMIDDGYGYGHNNMWMSNDIGLDNYKKSNKENKATVTGHIDDIMNNYDERKNENPSLYLIKKNLNLPNQKKYSGQTSEQGLYQGDYFENEKNYINKNIRSKGYTYQDISGDNNLIQSFTPEQDTLLGSVTLTPEMWKDIYSSKSDKEAKQKLFKMANVSPEEQKNFDNTFIHMNLNNPKQLNTYKKAKSKLPNTNWDANRLKPSMALGGTMGGGNPTLPPLKPTASDSLAVYNSAMNFQNQMKDLGYQQEGTFDMFNAYDQFINTGEFGLTNGKLKVKSPDRKLEEVKLTGTAAAKYPNKQVKDVGDFYSNKKIDDYKYNVAELLSPLGYNTDLPYQVLDERIAPQGAAKYTLSNPLNPKAEDAAIMLNYDPVAIKPYAMRTPQEQAEVERKYGKVIQPISAPPASKIVPVTDLRNDTKQYLRTLENLDDKNNFIEYLRSGTLTGQEAKALAPIDIQRRANAWKSGMAYGGMVDPLMAFGGMIDPTMAMQQMMYGSYAQGGQVPQNIPVEVEGEEMYEMPNGQTGEFSGPKHENGGIPIALPEGTKIYSDRLKVNGKTMAARKDKREANINKLEKLLTKNPNDKFIKEALKRQQETASLEEQGDMQMQEQANQQQQMEEMAMEEMLMGAAQQDMQEGMMMAMGGMIKRADGSYSQRGLWDNIRANRGSGKKPTKEMLKQEKKIRAAEKAYGGMIKYADGGKIPQNILRSRLESHMSSQEADSYLNKYQGGTDDSGIPPYNPYGLMTNEFFSQPTMQAPSYPTMMTTDNYSQVTDESPLKSYSTTPVTQNMYSLKTTTGTEDDELRYTEGDRTGMAGTAVGMYGPTLMTLLNRMETPPNQNFYNTYGQDALKTQMEAEGIAGQAKDEAYRKNIMRANALRNAIANSARGVGDMRTQQLTAALTEQEGARDILGSYLQSMAGLKGQRANLQAQIDQTRMGGEYQRDLADRQDVDQFYTNLAQNLTGVSEGMQKMGRDKNIAKRNEDILSLSKNFSAYGIYVGKDKKGNLVLKDQNSDKELSEKETEEMIKKAKKEKGER